MIQFNNLKEFSDFLPYRQFNFEINGWNKKGDFKKLLLKDQKVLKILTKKEIEMIFDLDKHTKNITYIYNRVFK